MSNIDFGIQVLVSTKNARAGTRQLQKDLEKTGAAGEKAGRRASRGLDEVRKSAFNLEKQVLKLAVAFGGIFVVPKIIGLLDTYQQLENRLRVVTETSEQLQSAFEGLADVSQRTRSSLRGSVELYARLALSTKELGLNQRQLLGLTESINQAIIISGASAKEAENGLIQLSQGLASGALRGDELRSVLEQLPRVADVIAESLGVTRGELRKLGEEGALSAMTILRAFEESQQSLQEEFAQTQQTLGQALTQLTNEFIKLGNSSGTVQVLTDALRASINALAFVIGPLVNTLILMGTAWLVLKTRMLLASAASAKMAATTGILGERLKVTNFWANTFGKTLKRHPVLLLGSIILTGAIALKGMSKAFDDVGDAAKNAAEPIDQFFVDTKVKAFGQQLIDTQRQLNRIANDPNFADAADRMRMQISRLLNNIKQLRSPTVSIKEELRGEIDLLSMAEDKRDEYTKMLAYEQRLARVGIDLRAESNQSLRAEILSLVRLVEWKKKSNEEDKKRSAANAKLFTEAWTSAMEKASDATADFFEKLSDLEDQIRETAADFGSAKLASEEYLKNVQLLDAALYNGLLTQDEYNNALKKLANESLPEVEIAADAAKRGVDDLSTALWEGFAQTALSNTEDAIADFVVRGRGNFKTFVNAVLEDLLRMITRLLILLPLINALKSAFGGTSVNYDAGNAMYGDGFTTDQFGNPISQLQNGGSFLVGQSTSRFPGFANGGGMMVGGNGGTDSQLVAFRASPNERVTVTRPEQSIGGNTTVNVSVHNNAPGTEARVEQGENGDTRVIIDQIKGAISADISRGGTGLNAALEGRYGLNGASGIQLG